MTTFDDRERAEESKFAHDAELRFRAEARRNKLVGLWAAELLGHSNPQAYAAEVVAADFEEVGHDDVVRKVLGDLDKAGAGVSEADVRTKMAELLEVAKAQVLKEG